MTCSDAIDELFLGEPRAWIETLPEFQRNPIDELLNSNLNYSEVAERWATASAENTFRFGAIAPIGQKSGFLDNLKKEVRLFLCGDPKYQKDREGLFSKSAVIRTQIVSGMAVAIAYPLGVAAAVIAPLIALILASIGKVALNAWCALDES